MKKHEIPDHFEVVQQTPVYVLRHIKDNTYHYYDEGVEISSPHVSIAKAVEAYHQMAESRSKD